MRASVSLPLGVLTLTVNCPVPRVVPEATPNVNTVAPLTKELAGAAVQGMVKELGAMILRPALATVPLMTVEPGIALPLLSRTQTLMLVALLIGRVTEARAVPSVLVISALLPEKMMIVEAPMGADLRVGSTVRSGQRAAS